MAVMHFINKYSNDTTFNITNNFLTQLMPLTTIQLLKRQNVAAIKMKYSMMKSAT